MSMGFYVNLEMPEDCPMCPFAYYDMFNTFMGCDITRGKRLAVKNDKDYAESSTRPDWCPLIEVPEPHGRLGDLDALEQDAQKRLLMCKKNDNQFQAPYEVMRAIALAPTIIPASKEE